MIPSTDLRVTLPRFSRASVTILGNLQYPYNSNTSVSWPPSIVMKFPPLYRCCQVASVVSDSVRPHRRQPTRVPHPWDSPGKNTGVGCHFLLQCMKVKSEREVTQSCQTLSNSWTAAHQAPPSMGFSREEYWSGVPLPSPTVTYQ